MCLIKFFSFQEKMSSENVRDLKTKLIAMFVSSGTTATILLTMAAVFYLYLKIKNINGFEPFER